MLIDRIPILGFGLVCRLVEIRYLFCWHLQTIPDVLGTFDLSV